MPVIIVDIDGTLLNGSSGIRKTIDYVNAQSKTHDIYIVTGRSKSEEAATRKALADNGVRYDRLYLNPGPTSQTLLHKKIITEKLQTREHVVMAIDNNENMRKMYSSLGLEVKNPTNL